MAHRSAQTMMGAVVHGTQMKLNMNLLTAFGLVAVTLMLVFYALERRSRWYTLAFAGACALGFGVRVSPGSMAVRIGRGCVVARCQSGAGG